MPDRHPPTEAVAAVLHEACRHRLLEGHNEFHDLEATIALRALATDPAVREWAATVPCIRGSAGMPWCGFGYVHPECLLAALAPAEERNT